MFKTIKEKHQTLQFQSMTKSQINIKLIFKSNACQNTKNN
jgi:hypothetical protein